MPYAVISRATSGEVLAATAGKRIRVVAYVMTAAGAVTAEWRSATTPISGAMSMITGVPIVGQPMPEGIAGQKGHFETAQGAALNLELGSGVQVSGHLVYELVP